MKTAVLAAAGAAVLSSLLTALLLRADAPPAPREDPGLAALRSALEEAQARIRSLESRPAPPGSGAAAAPAPGGAPPAPPPSPDEAPGPDEPPGKGPEAVEAAPAAEPEDESTSRVQARKAAMARPAVMHDRLVEAGKWDDSPEVRQRWTLLPEPQILSTFGKPDEVTVSENGVENWIYYVRTGAVDEQGRDEWEDVTLQVSRGRLVRVWN